MWILFAVLSLIGTIGYGWFVPIEGLRGGNSTMADIFLYVGAFCGGVAVLGYYENK